MGKEKFDISYLGSNIVINVKDDNWELEDLYEQLGDIDIVECNEISYTGESILVDSARNVYLLSTSCMSDIRNHSGTVLCLHNNLVDYVDLNKYETRKFLAWYFATTTGHGNEEQEQREAIKLMFENVDWVCTDPDTMQFRKELIPGKEYRFVQCNKYPDGTQNWVFDEYDIDEEEVETLVDACASFGYSKEDVEKWISLGESTDLILECLFETQN